MSDFDLLKDTPFMIGCPKCGETAMSFIHPQFANLFRPTHEWILENDEMTLLALREPKAFTPIYQKANRKSSRKSSRRKRK